MRPRLRHVAIPIYAIGLAALALAMAAGTIAIATGNGTDAFLAYALAAALIASVVWRWRIAPRGREARAAYHELEAAIDAAPPGPLRQGDHILTARPSRLLPELHREPLDQPPITDTYTLLWAPPLTLHHAGTNQPVNARTLARYTWHTLTTGQTFVDAHEMRALASQLRHATRQGRQVHE